MTEIASALLAEIRAALGDSGPPAAVSLPDGGSLPSVFAVSDLAQASVGAAGGAIASLIAGVGGGAPQAVTVDRDLASAWFRMSIRPQGWNLPPMWDPVAGDYAGADGWIRLHTNAPHHRAAALGVLGVPEDRDAVTAAVAGWSVEALEEAVVAAGGAAAAMRSLDAWKQHPQGRAVATEPLLHVERTAAADRSPAGGPGGRGPAGGRGGLGPAGGRGGLGPAGWAERPLNGVRVLDLTRVLAGPVATRLLAGWGAEVLRIDPHYWDEPAIAPEVTLGKRCARVDLRTPTGKELFLELLRSADILVHGYRADALDGLGLGAEVRAEHRPALIDVSLDAYGWNGPWHTRRGFDSLVQMSAGIADAGRIAAGTDRPTPLPVQALDHATGYLLAAAAITGLLLRHADGGGSRWRASLARTASLLIGAGVRPGLDETNTDSVPPEPKGPIEHTAWGEARRLRPPLQVDGAPLRWTLPARPLGTDEARWEA